MKKNRLLIAVLLAIAVDAEVLQDRWGLDTSALLRATNTAKKAALKLAQPVKERTQ